MLPGEEAAAAEQAPLELPWRRLHPLSPLLRGGLFLLVIVGILVANLRDRIFELFFSADYIEVMGPNESDVIDYLVVEGLIIWVLIGLLVVVLMIVGFSWIVWRVASFRITSEAVESRWGVIFKQHRRAPLERIQSVNLQRSLLARVLGLTQVDIQTAGQGGKVALQYLGHRDAKQVREQILRAANASRATAGGAVATTSGAAADGSGIEPGSSGAVAMSVLEEDRHAQTAVDFRGRAYAAPTGPLDARIHDLADFDIDQAAVGEGSFVKVPLGRLIASILLSAEMTVLLVIVVIIVVSSVWSSPFFLATLLPVLLVWVSILIGQFNKGFNFVLSRSSDGVRVGAGLTSTTTETIPFGRVHAVEASQPLGWRPFGWWKMRITTAGHSASQAGQNKMQNTVLPVGKIDDVLRVFEALLHGDPEGYEARQAALRDALVGDAHGFIGAGRRSAVVLWFSKGRAGVRIEDAGSEQASLRVRRGWFTRSLGVMPILRAQSIQLSRPFMHRFLGLATLQAHTVLGPVRMYVSGLALDEATDAFAELASTVVRVQGAEAQRVAQHVAPRGQQRGNQ